MKRINLLILCAIILSSCSSKEKELEMAKWKQEIIEMEQAFNDMAKEKGIPQAFLAFADDQAVLRRGETLHIGKEAIKLNFGEIKEPDESQSLVWKPDFVDVSASGDMAYTYGKYTYTVIDSLGIKRSSEGIFHTIWKRQEDGSWKYVWD